MFYNFQWRLNENDPKLVIDKISRLMNSMGVKPIRDFSSIEKDKYGYDFLFPFEMTVEQLEDLKNRKDGLGNKGVGSLVINSVYYEEEEGVIVSLYPHLGGILSNRNNYEKLIEITDTIFQTIQPKYGSSFFDGDYYEESTSFEAFKDTKLPVYGQFVYIGKPFIPMVDFQKLKGYRHYITTFKDGTIRVENPHFMGEPLNLDCKLKKEEYHLYFQND